MSLLQIRSADYAELPILDCKLFAIEIPLFHWQHLYPGLSTLYCAVYLDIRNLSSSYYERTSDLSTLYKNKVIQNGFTGTYKGFQEGVTYEKCDPTRVNLTAGETL
ncbi:hypothetical protein FKM82_014731 [Ascaphus truei]